jgi:serine/threonine-protein kinase
MDKAADLAPGARVAGYVLDERIGAGLGLATFRAHDEVTGRMAALKIVDSDVSASQELRSSFLAGAQAIAGLGHPFAVPLFGAGDDGGMLYVASRHVYGARVLGPEQSVLAPARSLALIEQVASALDAAHAAGIAHQSLTPGNVLIGTFPGRPEQALVSDFALPSLVHSAAAAMGDYLTNPPPPKGDPDYWAPERHQGRPGDARSDQYSLGCIAFRMLTGSAPFRRPSPVATLLAHVYDTLPRMSGLRPGLPTTADVVLAQATAKDHGGRFATCGEFAAALRTAMPTA